MTERFVELLDPCDRYLIWDERTDQPAILNGRVLVFARRHAAVAFAAMLNRMEAGRADWETAEIAVDAVAPALLRAAR